MANRGVTDVLSIHGSESDNASADYILPTLIFCLIHAPPAIKIISDLLFIQRFRARKALDGEAAYCLTNLEAAISFLETVDLATLNLEDLVGDEKAKVEELIPPAEDTKPEVAAPQPEKNVKRAASRGRKPVRELMLVSRDGSEAPFTPADDPLSNLSGKLLTAKIDYSLRAAEAAWQEEVAKTPSPMVSRFPDSVRSGAHAPPPAASLASTTNINHLTTPRNRTLSYITNPVADVAGTVVNTADVGIKTIGGALEGSYRFLFGKMDEKKAEMPKTLEDARKLVEQPPLGAVSPEGRESLDSSLSLDGGVRGGGPSEVKNVGQLKHGSHSPKPPVQVGYSHSGATTPATALAAV